jgi:predicted TIM-barrel fold metal-dependent hydrolase
VERLTVVSGDGHAGAPIEAYRPYLPAKYHDALDELAAGEARTYLTAVAEPSKPLPEVLAVYDHRHVVAGDGADGSFDIDIRLRELDAEGVAAEIVHSGTQISPPLWYGIVNSPVSPEMQWAGVQAYHRWLADVMSTSNGRMNGVAEPGPCLDMDASIAELRWLAEHHFVSVGVPGQVASDDLPPLYDSYYEPYWAACEELGLVLSMHAGWGQKQGLFQQAFSMMMGADGQMDMEAIAARRARLKSGDEPSPFRLDNGPQRGMWQLMMGGAFDRHPNLRLAITEVRADWVPTVLSTLDAKADELAIPLKMKPSEYFRQNCGVTPSSIHQAEIDMRADIGIEQLMFGTDYPHHEGTWPNTLEWIQVAFAGVPENEARLILGDNAINFYRLDRAHLDAIAAQIGPVRDEVLLAKHDISDALIGDFHRRSGFSRSADPVAVDVIATALAEDAKGLAAAGAR